MTEREEELLSAWLDGELGEDEIVEVQALLAVRSDLREHLARLEADRERLGMALAMGPVPADRLAALTAKLRSRAEGEATEERAARTLRTPTADDSGRERVPGDPSTDVATPWLEAVVAWLSPPRLALAGALVLALAWVPERPARETGTPPGAAPAGTGMPAPGRASPAGLAVRGEDAPIGLPLRIEELPGPTSGAFVAAASEDPEAWVARLDGPGDDIEILWLVTPDA